MVMLPLELRIYFTEEDDLTSASSRKRQWEEDSDSESSSVIKKYEDDLEEENGCPEAQAILGMLKLHASPEPTESSTVICNDVVTPYAFWMSCHNSVDTESVSSPFLLATYPLIMLPHQCTNDEEWGTPIQVSHWYKSTGFYSPFSACCK